MRKCLLLLALTCSSALSASTASTGTLGGIHFMSNGVVIVYTTGTRSTDVPTCALNQAWRFAVDGTTAAGKVQVAGLLTAYTTGKPVAIIGAGNCNAYSDTETISYFHTVD